jgi:S-disulfanyl-L-cysteine oxidoreductase SoxD
MRTALTGLISGVFLAAIASVVAAQSATSKTMWDGVFTDAQALRGQQTYKQSCALCHKDDLLGDSGTPALAGPEFLNRFNGSTVDDVLQTVRASMPQDAPDSLGTARYVDLISFLLKTNGAPAGAAELPQDRESLKQLRMTSKP